MQQSNLETLLGGQGGKRRKGLLALQVGMPVQAHPVGTSGSPHSGNLEAQRRGVTCPKSDLRQHPGRGLDAARLRARLTLNLTAPGSNKAKPSAQHLHGLYLGSKAGPHGEVGNSHLDKGVLPFLEVFCNSDFC